jgi:hypothetical protein
MKQCSHPETVAVPFYVKTWMRKIHVLLVNDLAIEFTQSMFQKKSFEFCDFNAEKIIPFKFLWSHCSIAGMSYYSKLISCGLGLQ